MSNLVEQETKIYLFRSLGRCHEVKMRMFSIIINVSSVLILGVGLAWFLSSRYRGPETQQARDARMNAEKHKILKKLREYEFTAKRDKSREGYREEYDEDSSILSRLPTASTHRL
jgi:hypothetical protein